MNFIKAMTPELSLWSLTPEEARENLADLLFLADESWQMIDKYLAKTEIWALKSKTDFVASIAVEPKTNQQWEIMNLAVDPRFQGHGLGSRLIKIVSDAARATDQKELLVGTGDASISNLSFYLHNGFRFAQIRFHFFDQYSEPIEENGIQLRDMIVLNKRLTD